MQLTIAGRLHKDYVDLTGLRVGKLVVLHRDANRSSRKPYWICKCDCGNTASARGESLRKSKTRHCGCSPRDGVGRNPVHGMSGSRLYHIWASMKQRCVNPKSKDYKWYGAKGVVVCDLWLGDFLEFHEWAKSHGYEESLEIDRINSDGNYEPGNCRWVTRKENQANIKSPGRKKSLA